MAKNNPNSIKKIFQLEINTSGCNYQIWLNGISADIQYVDTPIFYDLTINPWLKFGTNILEIKMIPITGNEELSNYAYFRGKVITGELEGEVVVNKNIIKEFSSPNFSQLRYDNDEIVIKEFRLNDTIDSDIGHNNRMYTDLIKVNADYFEIQSLYNKVKNLFDTKQSSQLLDLMKFKIGNYSNSVYKEDVNEYNRQKAIIDKLILKETVPIDYKYYDLRVDFTSKLYSMIDDEGTQPLAFIVDGEIFTFYPIYFGQTIKGKWEIIL